MIHAAASYQRFRIYKPQMRARAQHRLGQGHDIDEGEGKQEGKGKTINYFLPDCWYLWRKQGPHL